MFHLLQKRLTVYFQSTIEITICYQQLSLVLYFKSLFESKTWKSYHYKGRQSISLGINHLGTPDIIIHFLLNTPTCKTRSFPLERKKTNNLITDFSKKSLIFSRIIVHFSISTTCKPRRIAHVDLLIPICTKRKSIK